ncbi:MAG: hypothetical protein ACRYG7_01885 [Janthinobacterium lividum]
MVDILATYCSILRRGIEICDEISALYQPDWAIDWASRTLMQTAAMRIAFADRLNDPELMAEQTSSVTKIIDHYLDNHWADYDRFIKPDPTKHQQVLQLHSALKTLMDEVVELTNALLKAE